MVDPITAPHEPSAEPPRIKIIERLLGLLNELNGTLGTGRDQLVATVVYEADAEVSLYGSIRQGTGEFTLSDFGQPTRAKDLGHVISGPNGAFRMNFIRENLAIDILHREFGNLGIGVWPIKNPFHVSQFVRDPFVVLQRDSGEPVLMRPFYLWPTSTSKTNEQALVSRYIPDILSDQLGHHTTTTCLLVEGGNILSGDDFAVVGHRMVETNLTVHAQNDELNSLTKLLVKLADSLGVAEVFCPDYDFEDAGTGARPEGLYHLDLFLTLLGAQFSETTVALGTIKVWNGKEWKDAPADDPDQAYLDEYAQVLRRGQGEVHRFIIKRLPLLRHEGAYFSYNNCLVETAPNGQVSLLLPTFKEGVMSDGQPDFEAMDKEVERLVKRWKMNPRMIRRNFRSLGKRGAGLRCITQVLRRS